MNWTFAENSVGPSPIPRLSCSWYHVFYVHASLVIVKGEGVLMSGLCPKAYPNPPGQ